MRPLRTLLFATLLCLCTQGAYAQNKSAEQKKLDAVRKEMSELESQIKANNSKSADATTQLALTRKRIEAEKKLVDESTRELNSINSQVEDKKAELAAAQAQYDKAIAAYEKLIRTAYVNRDARLWFAYILNANSLEQTVRRYAYFQDLSSTMHDEATRIANQKKVIEAEKAQLDSLKNESAAVLAERERDLKALHSDEAKEKATINQLAKDKKAYQKKLDQKKKEADALNKKLTEMVKSSSSKKSSSSSSKGKSSTGKSSPKDNVDVKLSNEFASNKGKLPWPVAGTIVGQFGEHYHPVYKNVKLPFNNGVNIATKAGEPVRAVFSGVVKNVVVMPGYNQCVLLQHGNYYTFYCKMKGVSVKTGDKVAVGDTLGSVDTISGETQLHFQLWKDTNPQDPEKWLR